MFDWLSIIALSILEGITEFLPVSSTGHMIVAADYLGLKPTPQLDAFIVIIQVGAILAVVTAYRKNFMDWILAWLAYFGLSKMSDQQASRHRFYSLMVALAVIPFGAIGYLNKDFIKALFHPTSVALALIFGGLLMLVEQVASKKAWLPMERSSEKLSLVDASVIGFGQCLSLWPGFSRAAATLLAARLRGYSRPAAAELSFLIGLPTIVGTGAYELKSVSFQTELLPYILIGSLIAAITAYVSVKLLLAYLSRHTLAAFAWYRIFLGALILLGSL